jgi:hypothetical protein
MSATRTTRPQLVTPQFVLLGSAGLAYFLAEGMLAAALVAAAGVALAANGWTRARPVTV